MEYYYMRAASGNLVRVPADRLEAWQKEQEKLKDPEYAKKVDEEIQRLLSSEESSREKK